MAINHYLETDDRNKSFFASYTMKGLMSKGEK